jgi:hypothetical protein
MPEAIAASDKDAFREEAYECRVLAASAASALDRETWLRLAVEWQKLADEAEKRMRFKSPLWK